MLSDQRRNYVRDNLSASHCTVCLQPSLPRVQPSTEDLDQNQLNQQQLHRQATVKTADASPENTPPPQRDVFPHPADARQQNGNHAAHSDLDQSHSLTPKEPPAHTGRSSPGHNPTIAEPRASPQVTQGTPALSDKFIAEIQKALEDSPHQNTNHAAHPSAPTATARTGISEGTPVHASNPERAGAQPPQPGRPLNGAAALRPGASGPCDSSQHSASIAPTERQATGSATTGGRGRPCSSHRTGDGAPGFTGAHHEAVDSPSKQSKHPSPKVSHKAPPRPGSPLGPPRHTAASAEPAAARLKPRQQAAGESAAAGGLAARNGGGGRPNPPIQRIQFVPPEATGLSVSLEEMARNKKKAPPPAVRATAAGSRLPPSLHGPLRLQVGFMAPQPALPPAPLPPKPAERAALVPPQSSQSAVHQRRPPEDRRPGNGDDIAHAGMRKRRLEEMMGASIEAPQAHRTGMTGGHTRPRPQVRSGSSEKDRKDRRSGDQHQPDRGRPAPEERGAFISNKTRPEVASAGNDSRRDGSRYQRLPASARASADGRDKGRPSRMSPLPGPPPRAQPPRARPPRSPSPLKVSPRASPLLLDDDDDDDSGDEVLPFGGGGRGLDRVHVVDESDEELLLGEMEPRRGASSVAAAASGAPSGSQAPGSPSVGPRGGYSSAQERVLSGLTAAEIAQAERRMRDEEQLPAALRVDALAAATGAIYDSLLDACKMYERACVFCARDHKKVKGHCERLRSLSKAQTARWREISTKRHKARLNRQLGLA